MPVVKIVNAKIITPGHVINEGTLLIEDCDTASPLIFILE